MSQDGGHVVALVVAIAVAEPAGVSQDRRVLRPLRQQLPKCLEPAWRTLGGWCLRGMARQRFEFGQAVTEAHLAPPIAAGLTARDVESRALRVRQCAPPGWLRPGRATAPRPG